MHARSAGNGSWNTPQPDNRRRAHYTLGMKFVVVIVVVGVAVGAYYVYRNPTVVTPLVEGTPLESAVRETLGTTRVYKWRDADGVWHITDEPPPEGTKFEKLEYVNDANVVPSVPKKTTKKN